MKRFPSCCLVVGESVKAAWRNGRCKLYIDDDGKVIRVRASMGHPPSVESKVGTMKVRSCEVLRPLVGYLVGDLVL